MQHHSSNRESGVTDAWFRCSAASEEHQTSLCAESRIPFPCKAQELWSEDLQKAHSKCMCPPNAILSPRAKETNASQPFVSLRAKTARVPRVKHTDRWEKTLLSKFV